MSWPSMRSSAVPSRTPRSTMVVPRTSTFDPAPANATEHEAPEQDATLMAEDPTSPAALTDTAAAEERAVRGDPGAPGEPTAPEDPVPPEDRAVLEEAPEPDEPAPSEQADSETTTSAPTRTPVYLAAMRLTCGTAARALMLTFTSPPPAG